MITNRAYAALLWACSFLFAVRVLGQAVQRWSPQSFLPDFGSFQGSGLPYWLLLSSQSAILGAMLWYAWRVQTRALRASERAGRVLMWLGWIYMLGSIARIGIGIAVPTAPAWFRASIPATFHLVLAAYVLTLAYYHRQRA